VKREAMLPALLTIEAFASKNEPDTEEMALWCIKQLTSSS
jgi:hypothetical protein